MRIIISILVGIIAAVLVFMGMGLFINLIVSGATGDLRIILKVACWLVFGGFTIWVAIILGVLAGNAFDSVIDYFKIRNKWKQKRKSLKN